MLKRTGGWVGGQLTKNQKSPPETIETTNFKHMIPGEIRCMLFVFIVAVKDHDNAAGPEEQCAEAGAEEPVSEEPKGAATNCQQPPHTPS